MASFSGLPPVRDDFRCSLCRQKGAFHCEHDTPYRDQLLGTYEQEKPYIPPTNSRRESQRVGSHNTNNSAHNNKKQKTNTGQNTSSNPGARYQQDRRPDNTSLSNTNPHGSVKTNEAEKKNKSCVIL